MTTHPGIVEGATQSGRADATTHPATFHMSPLPQCLCEIKDSRLERDAIKCQGFGRTVDTTVVDGSRPCRVVLRATLRMT